MNELYGDYIRTYSDKSIRIDMVYTELKKASIIFRFEKDEETGEITYPKSAAMFELKSTTIPARLVGILVKKLE